MNGRPDRHANWRACLAESKAASSLLAAIHDDAVKP